MRMQHFQPSLHVTTQFNQSIRYFYFYMFSTFFIFFFLHISLEFRDNIILRNPCNYYLKNGVLQLFKQITDFEVK